ncbi:ABC transporter permease [Acetobacteraceae bacterium]|nr:ABC transporter permease [Acetobacteraceae bacterium]
MVKVPVHFHWIEAALSALGKFVFFHPRFFLTFIGVSWGVITAACVPASWRRSVKIDFWRTLNQAALGGVPSTLVTAILGGIGIVTQAVYWLGFAGMSQSTGSVLSGILVKEIGPLLVGIILLGRSGSLIVADLSSLSLSGQIKAFEAMGVDSFLQFMMPRTVALTLSSFTLGMLFSVIALVTGYVACWAENTATMPIWSFLYQVTSSIDPINYIAIPVKFLLTGFAVGISSTLTGLDVSVSENMTKVIPKGFTRGIVAILILNVAADVLIK